MEKITCPKCKNEADEMQVKLTHESRISISNFQEEITDFVDSIDFPEADDLDYQCIKCGENLDDYPNYIDPDDLDDDPEE